MWEKKTAPPWHSSDPTRASSGWRDGFARHQQARGAALRRDDPEIEGARGQVGLLRLQNMALKVTVQKWHEVVERISRKVAVEYVWRGCWVWEGW